MKEYAIIERPFRPKRFTIQRVFHESYLKAIEEFKRSENYTPTGHYAVFNVDEEDNRQEFYYITDFQ